MPAGDHRAAREGPFWDVLEGRREPPPAAVLLRFRLVPLALRRYRAMDNG